MSHDAGPRPAPWTALLLCLLALPAVLVPDAVGEASALRELARGPHPYFLPGHAWLLYLKVPAALLGALVLFLGPGLCLAAGSAASAATPGWLLRGFGLALPIAAFEVALAAQLPGQGPSGRAFAILPYGTLIAAAVAGLVRARGRGLTGAVPDRAAPWLPWLMIGMTLALLLALLPKILWEDFNGDGAHGFLASRLLLRQGWPFFDPESGPVASFPGVTSMLFAWPNAWFLRLFGEHEAAVRLPYLLHLPVLAAGIAAVAEHGRRPLRWLEWIAVWAGLLSFTLAMAFSATYSPYHADLAMPGTQDVLMMACLLGWVHALLRQDWRWVALFGAGVVCSLPSGTMLLGLWLGAHWLVVRPRPWRQTLVAGALVAGALLAARILPHLLQALGVPGPGEEYGSGALSRYFEYLQFTDWRRFGYVGFASGLLPALVLLWWRGQDSLARSVTLAVAAYFGLFYVMANISLHHFVPAMVLPLVVAARCIPEADPGRGRYVAAWLAAAAVAVVVSLPRSFAPYTTDRAVGARISELVGDYAGSDPAVFRAGELLANAIPRDWDGSVPDRSYGGSPLVWLHYATHGALSDSTLLVLARAGTPPPSGMAVLDSSPDAVLYVRDTLVLPGLRSLRPDTAVGSPVYAVPRGVLWRGQPGGPRVYALEGIRRRLGRWFHRPEA